VQKGGEMNCAWAQTHDKAKEDRWRGGRCSSIAEGPTKRGRRASHCPRSCLSACCCATLPADTRHSADSGAEGGSVVTSLDTVSGLVSRAWTTAGQPVSVTGQKVCGGQSRPSLSHFTEFTARPQITLERLTRPIFRLDAHGVIITLSTYAFPHQLGKRCGECEYRWCAVITATHSQAL
jgi:hypothetical protein